MKLVAHHITVDELQEWLDKYQDKVKAIYPCIYMSSARKITIIVDEE